jgi:hypothetical protein
MDPLFTWLEHTAPSLWIRESLSIFAFPGILTMHTLGLGIVAGISAALDLRVLGVAPALPEALWNRYSPIFWAAFWATTLTGAALVLAYPAKALTNPLFYVKLILIALAMGSSLEIRRRTRSNRTTPGSNDNGAEPANLRLRRLASASLFFWAAAIVSGRLLAYTYTRLLT